MDGVYVYVSFFGFWSLMLYAMLLETRCGEVSGQSVQPRRDAEYPPAIVKRAMKFVHDTCIEQTGVSEDAIKRFSDGDAFEDDALKCYMFCQFDVIGVLHDTGDLHLDSYHSLMPSGIYEIIVNMNKGCAIQGETKCDRAYSLHSCWKKNDPKHYFLL